MILYSNVKEKFAISLRDVTLRKLLTLIEECYPNNKIHITSVLQNKTEVSFDDIEELLSYENSGEYKIKELTIDTCGKDDWKSNCKINFNNNYHLFFAYGSTIKVDFILKSIDESIAFRAKIKHIFKEMRLPLSYTILSKISIPSIFLVVFGIHYLYGTLQPKSVIETTVPLSVFAIFLLCIIGIFTIMYGLNILLAKLFPPIHYLWGKGIESYEKITKTHSKIFWVVIMGIIVSITASVFLKYF